MSKKRLTLSLALLLVFLLGSVSLAGILKTHKPANAAGPGDWSTYLHDPARTGFNSTETAINPSSAGQLKQLWSVSEGSIIPTQPVIANSKIYWGSWDGIEHATNLDGSQAWTANLGTAPSNCGGALGVMSTATVASVTINGTATSLVFVGSANDQFYALNAATGAI